jgi:glutamine amidotransferase
LVGIIDYGMGNLKSVYNAFDYVGEDVLIIDELLKFDECTHLIIPGVGSYKRAMENLNHLGYIEPIIRHHEDKKPILGICLGMQILSTIGQEPSICNGLNIIEGEVMKFDIDKRVPHVGWNSINTYHSHPVLSGIKDSVDFYFVHSYIFKPKNQKDTLATTTYQDEFSSIISKNNTVGIQFHPEKSQENGLKIIENFAQWDGLC